MFIGCVPERACLRGLEVGLGSVLVGGVPK